MPAGQELMQLETSLSKIGVSKATTCLMLSFNPLPACLTFALDHSNDLPACFKQAGRADLHFFVFA